MRRAKYYLAVLLMLTGSCQTGWSQAEADPASSTKGLSEGASSAAGIEFFESRVRPILVDHCYECHALDENSGGLRLDSRDAVLAGGDSGTTIVPGDVESSRMIHAIRYTNPDLQMPPDGRLEDEQIRALEEWIAIGAPDPREGVSTSASNAGMSIEQGREFWSFRPIASVPVPAVEANPWVQTPIDAFILAGLQAQGLSPAPRADRATLMRRVTYDLTGLPPSDAEINAFVEDDSPVAYKKLVERLLASEQYGARWGRHWLDVARYADSNGLDENLAFGNAWRYRDWVIDAFNDDQPFDQFVIEQLAGDLLPNADERTKTATGFLVLGAKVLAEPDREKLEMDTIDEQIDTTGKALLGMTFGCVRCHDHKFDPVTQRDYYALAAIFKSTRTFADTNTGAIKHWNEHLFATEQEIAANKEFDDLIAKKTSAASEFKNQATEAIRKQSRELATEYLVAATMIELDMSLRQIEQVAIPRGLHPRILHHCRRHLHFHQDDPLFAPWHAMSGPDRADTVEKHYRPLFAGAMQSSEPSPENASANSALDAQIALARAAINDPSGFLAVPPQPQFAFDPATLAEYDRLMEDARLVESRAPDLRAAMGVSDATVFTSLPIHIRGSHRNLGEPVDRGVPAVMQLGPQAVSFPQERSGRLELATWIASGHHPLTARVYVNRLWRWHFGQGIVRSTENFGVLGDRPSHPELLDWLANYFVDSGWSTKAMHRLILHSSTYQQQSVGSDEDRGAVINADNRLLWKYPLQRLDAEQLHDSILAVSGQLDLSLRGKTVPLRNRQFVFNHTSVDHTRYDALRRAVYLPVIRNNLYTTFEQFDFPDPTMPTGDRGSTTVAPQALLLMNSESVMKASDAIARQLLGESASDESRIEMLFQRVLGRDPSRDESSQASELLRDLTAKRAEPELAWSMLCQSLIACNEFIYLR